MAGRRDTVLFDHGNATVDDDDGDAESILEFYSARRHGTVLSPVPDTEEPQSICSPEQPLIPDSSAHLNTSQSLRQDVPDISDARSIVQEDDGEGPLVALIQDHAVQQYSQTSDIGHQVASLQQDVLAMSADLREVMKDQQAGSALRGLLEGLYRNLEDVGKRVGEGKVDGLDQLHEKIDSISARILEERSESANHKELVASQETLSTNVVRIQKDLSTNLPVILERLEALPREATDLSQVHAKLDELLTRRPEESLQNLPKSPPAEKVSG